MYRSAGGNGVRLDGGNGFAGAVITRTYLSLPLSVSFLQTPPCEISLAPIVATKRPVQHRWTGSMDPFGDKPQAFGPFSDGVMSFQSPRRPFWGLEKSFPPRKMPPQIPRTERIIWNSCLALFFWDGRPEWSRQGKSGTASFCWLRPSRHQPEPSTCTPQALNHLHNLFLSNCTVFFLKVNR